MKSLIHKKANIFHPSTCNQLRATFERNLCVGKGANSEQEMFEKNHFQFHKKVTSKQLLHANNALVLINAEKSKYVWTLHVYMEWLRGKNGAQMPVSGSLAKGRGNPKP